MNDWMADFVIDFEEDGQRYRTIWPGYTREGAIMDFKVWYPTRKVISASDTEATHDAD